VKAITVEPGVEGSVRLDTIDRPPGPDEGVLVRTVAVGVCGTDMEIIRGKHGAAGPGKTRLVLGHESLGVVEAAPPGSGFSSGDHVVGIVRRPDPVPCACCAAGRWDMCTNGLYVERGIKGADGYAAENFTIEPEYAVHVDDSLGVTGVLLEPTSIVAKAWRRIEGIMAVNCLEPEKVLVVGAGPIGLLAALLAVQRGFEVHVVDIVGAGPKPASVTSLGASYHTSAIEDACPGADLTLECTGVGDLVTRSMINSGPNGIVCLTGVSETGREANVDVGSLNRNLVLQNGVVIGSVNANREDYEAAARDLGQADRSWLEQLITRRVPLDSWDEAYVKSEADVKIVIAFD
jgi:threonine dehydrogenase-like Zn-dependent dehydrogenase